MTRTENNHTGSYNAYRKNNRTGSYNTQKKPHGGSQSLQLFFRLYFFLFYDTIDSESVCYNFSCVRKKVLS